MSLTIHRRISTLSLDIARYLDMQQQVSSRFKAKLENNMTLEGFTKGPTLFFQVAGVLTPRGQRLQSTTTYLSLYLCGLPRYLGASPACLAAWLLAHILRYLFPFQASTTCIMRYLKERTPSGRYTRLHFHHASFSLGPKITMFAFPSHPDSAPRPVGHNLQAP